MKKIKLKELPPFIASYVKVREIFKQEEYNSENVPKHFLDRSVLYIKAEEDACIVVVSCFDD